MGVRYPMLLLAMAGLGLGCAKRLKLPPGLDDAVPHAVTGRAAERFESHELNFGPYAAFSISRGYESSFGDRQFFGKSIDQLRAFPEEDSYSFRFKASVEWRTVCSTAPLHASISDAAAKHQLTCMCVEPGARTVAELQAASDSDELRGIIRASGKSYSLHGSREVEGSKKEGKRATGYVVSEGSRPLGAIDVLGNGIVWVVPDIPAVEQDILACAATALLLYH
jgi:hypothetical protein